MQKIDRKMFDLIVEARRLRGNSGSRWQADGQQIEPQSKVHGEMRDARPELARPLAGVRQTHFA
ncbi:MAG: hypothetical protein IIB66_01235 [Proteobacteria bacterium]|nr:hypothetical protein [Pseudomonadota bacterium]